MFSMQEVEQHAEAFVARVESEVSELSQEVKDKLAEFVAELKTKPGAIDNALPSTAPVPDAGIEPKA